MSDNLMVTSGNLLGTCGHCGQPACGRFDSDDNREESDDDKFWVEMECVNCHKKEKFSIEPECLAWEKT